MTFSVYLEYLAKIQQQQLIENTSDENRKQKYTRYNDSILTLFCSIQCLDTIRRLVRRWWNRRRRRQTLKNKTTFLVVNIHIHIPHTYEHSPIIISYIGSERHTDRLRLEDDDGDDGVYVCGCMYRADELEFKIDLPAD